ncbi:MAG: glycerol-3-phosphate 1-O-acyltransferase PlsY [bacterium]
MQIGVVVSLAVFSYLLGSVPTAFLVAKAHGIDIRTVGSGNVGATNVFRALGKWWGLLTFFSDLMKGFIPGMVFPLIAGRWLGYDGKATYLGLVCAALAIAGHNWPIYLHFKGGKGVATSAGALMGVAPIAGAIGLGAWLLVFLPTRYVSLASIVAALAISISAWILYLDKGPVLPGVLTVLAGILIIRHHANIGRLLSGTENRIEFRKKTSVRT